jgi:hypothetical protein
MGVASHRQGGKQGASRKNAFLQEIAAIKWRDVRGEICGMHKQGGKTKL